MGYILYLSVSYKFRNGAKKSINFLYLTKYFYIYEKKRISELWPMKPISTIMPVNALAGCVASTFMNMNKRQIWQ
ncbi:hypothetical protein D0Y50_18745 [Salinimonas sediminis]|uniref:Uncharacterized protein n=1 Tax=Salinimonas sediminis TaxID=2303538 RepID=A0A346NRQ5_9ALTE|nr:hypothetical protein D0Y50_18745 [Salinimonas sediminis]